MLTRGWMLWSSQNTVTGYFWRSPGLPPFVCLSEQYQWLVPVHSRIFQLSTYFVCPWYKTSYYALFFSVYLYLSLKKCKSIDLDICSTFIPTLVSAISSTKENSRWGTESRARQSRSRSNRLPTRVWAPSERSVAWVRSAWRIELVLMLHSSAERLA